MFHIIRVLLVRSFDGSCNEGYRLDSGLAAPLSIRAMMTCREDSDVPILVLVLLVDAAHERGGRGQDLIDKDEDGLLWGQLYAFADHIDELSDGEVGWHEVLLLVDGRNVRLLDLLADHWDTVRVLLTL